MKQYEIGRIRQLGKMKVTHERSYDLKQFEKEYHVLNLGFGLYLGVNARMKIPDTSNLGKFLRTEGFELNFGLFRILK